MFFFLFEMQLAVKGGSRRFAPVSDRHPWGLERGWVILEPTEEPCIWGQFSYTISEHQTFCLTLIWSGDHVVDQKCFGLVCTFRWRCFCDKNWFSAVSVGQIFLPGTVRVKPWQIFRIEELSSSVRWELSVCVIVSLVICILLSHQAHDICSEDQFSSVVPFDCLGTKLSAWCGYLDAE